MSSSSDKGPHLTSALQVMFRCWICGTNYAPEQLVIQDGHCPSCGEPCISDDKARARAVKWAKNLLDSGAA